MTYRIAHIVAHPPFREGTGTACYYNARALIDLGCKVTVFAPRMKNYQNSESLDFYRFLPCWLAIGNAYLTPHILDIQNVDILHLHFPFIFGSELTWIKAISSRIPLIITYHSDLIASGIRKPLFAIYHKLIAPIVLKYARKIAVTSHDYAFSAYYGKTLFSQRKDDLVEIGNGVDTEIFRPDLPGDIVRNRHQILHDETALLFVSSLDRSHARKGLNTLIDTLPLLNGIKVKLIIAGDGNMRLDYEKKVVNLGLGNRVLFTGRIPQAELPAYYAVCDMVVIPSRPPEAFGLSLAQGMAAGKPVIGSDIPGVRTLVRTGVDGFLIEPDDIPALAERIKTLAGDPQLRLEMGQSGRARIEEQFTWKKVGDRLLRLYQTTCHHDEN